MNFKQIETTDTLKDYINCFWYTERVFVEDNPFFEILPDGFAELIFFFGALVLLKKKTDCFLPFRLPLLLAYWINLSALKVSRSHPNSGSEILSVDHFFLTEYNSSDK